MSVIVIGRFKADPANLEKLIPEIMQAAKVQGPPEFQIYQAMESPDIF